MVGDSRDDLRFSAANETCTTDRLSTLEFPPLGEKAPVTFSWRFQSPMRHPPRNGYLHRGYNRFRDRGSLILTETLNQ